MDKYIPLTKAITALYKLEEVRDAEWGAKRFTTEDIENLFEESVEEDVAPIYHGKWLYFLSSWENIEYLQCSVCKKNVKGKYKYKYCPNCGAKMDGES